MSECKTLKDIEIPTGAFYGNNYPCHAVSCQDLRQEAIKWIKSLMALNTDDKFINDGEIFETYYDKEAIKWIKHFFNIKDEDLNE